VPKILLEQVQNGSRLLDALARLVDGLSAVRALPAAKLVDRLLELLGNQVRQFAGCWFPAFQLERHVLVPR
jgi:hypothetical protein